MEDAAAFAHESKRVILHPVLRLASQHVITKIKLEIFMRALFYLFISLSFLSFSPFSSFAQKKPLDHSVYDGWQSIGERKLSNDGKWVVYTIDLQEGDGELVVQATDNSFKQTYPRGYNITISNDSRYAVFRIKAPYADTRQARIKKKKPEDMPKDSLAIVELGKSSIVKIARVLQDG